MANKFCHMEFQAKDIKEAKKFYSELFDWELTDHDMGGGHIYTMVKTGNQPEGGMMQNPDPNSPPGWLVYIYVENLEDSVKKAAELGGKVIMDKTAVPGMGSFAVLFDSQGAVFAMWEEEKK